MSVEQLSKRAFFTTLALIPICTLAIFMGIAFTGGGHGVMWPFFAALTLCVLTGCLLIYSIITAVMVIRSGREAPWLMLAVPILLAAIGLGIWGLQG